MIHEDETKPPQVPKAPKLPREVYEKHFVADFRGHEHVLYPGPEKFALIDDVARDATSDFIEVVNPPDRPAHARASIFVGWSEAFGSRCEKLIIPAEHRADEITIRRFHGLKMPIRRGYLRVLLSIEPGAMIAIPKYWLPALRQVSGGVISSGQIPFLEVPSLDEKDPPVLHSALAGSQEPVSPRPPVGARRRPT